MNIKQLILDFFRKKKSTQKSIEIISVDFDLNLKPVALITKTDKINIDNCILINSTDRETFFRIHIAKDIIFLKTILENDRIYFEVVNFPEMGKTEFSFEYKFKNNDFIYKCFVDLGETLYKIGRKFDFDINNTPNDYHSIISSFIQIVVTQIETIGIVVDKSLKTKFFDYKSLYFMMRSIYEMYTTFDYLYTKYEDRERLLFNYYLWKLKELFKNRIETSSQSDNYKILNAETNNRIDLAIKFLEKSKYSHLLINKKSKKIEWNKLDWKLGKTYTALGLESGIPKKLFAQYYGTLSNFVHSSNESVVTNFYYQNGDNNTVYFLNIDSFYSNLNLLNIVIVNFIRKIEKFLRLNYPAEFESKFKTIYELKSANEGFKIYSTLIDSIEHE